jgi:hypothetical protein
MLRVDVLEPYFLFVVVFAFYYLAKYNSVS